MDLKEFFKTPIWSEQKPEFVNSLNKASNKYIKAARSRDNKKIKAARSRDKKIIKYQKDFGYSHHSTPLLQDNDFLDFKNYVGQKSWDFF